MMTRLLQTAILGEPVGKGRPRFSVDEDTETVRVRTPKKTKKWEEHAEWILRNVWRGAPALSCPVRVVVRAVYSRPERLDRKKDPDCRLWKVGKPDIDNVVKATLDAMVNASILVDDTQVVRLEAESVYMARDGKDSARVEIEIWTVGEAPTP